MPFICCVVHLFCDADSCSLGRGDPVPTGSRYAIQTTHDPRTVCEHLRLGPHLRRYVPPAADAVDKQHVAIDMTMTSPACPAGSQLIADTKRAVGGNGDVSAVEVRIVMDPALHPASLPDASTGPRLFSLGEVLCRFVRVTRYILDGRMSACQPYKNNELARFTGRGSTWEKNSRLG